MLSVRMTRHLALPSSAPAPCRSEVDSGGERLFLRAARCMSLGGQVGTSSGATAAGVQRARLTPAWWSRPITRSQFSPTETREEGSRVVFLLPHSLVSELTIQRAGKSTVVWMECSDES